jgi:hypothetical protein
MPAHLATRRHLFVFFFIVFFVTLSSIGSADLLLAVLPLFHVWSVFGGCK